MSGRYNSPKEEQQLHRMLSLGVSDITNKKFNSLQLLRDLSLSFANQLVASLFEKEPLLHIPTKSSIQKRADSFIKQYKGYNKSYAQKIADKVVTSLYHAHLLYAKRLVGRLIHASSPIKEPDNQRLYYYVPIRIQNTISKKELLDIQNIFKKNSFRKNLELCRRVILENDKQDFSSNQVEVFRECHRQVKQKHHPPIFRDDPFSVLQFHLDYRQIRNQQDEPIETLNKAYPLLFDSKNKIHKSFLELSHPVPHQKPIRLPIKMAYKTVKRLSKQSRIQSFVLELSNQKVWLKAVVSKTKPKSKGLEQYSTFVGRDFGYDNTITLSVAPIEQPINREQVEKLQKLSSTEAKSYLSGHYCKKDNIIKRVRFSGAPFLHLVNQHSIHIDRLSREISRIYNKIERLKGILAGRLGINKEEHIDKNQEYNDNYYNKLHSRFFRLLERVHQLKRKRRNLYRKIKAIKKNWFGFLSNRERELIEEYNGLSVVERLTIQAIKRSSDKYKGRTFNKMMRNGSRSLYEQMALDKMLWNGILQLKLPSYHTSSTCIYHAVVDKNMRKGQHFECGLCDQKRHADENAADTLANYLQLVPL